MQRELMQMRVLLTRASAPSMQRTRNLSRCGTNQTKLFFIMAQIKGYMGLNLDLNQIMNLPLSVRCPKCKTEIDTWVDDFDIESPD